MTTTNKDFIVKNGIVVNGTTATVNGNQVLTEASSINALNDVTITSATTGQVLKYNGTAWINDTDLTGGGSGNAFTTISISGQGDVVADSSSDTLTLVAGTFVTITTITASDSITFSASHSHAIDDLSDVVITSATTDQTLVYSTTGNWVNVAANPLTTKGDLLTRTSSDVTRLAVGTVNGYALTVNSSETTGLLWAPIGVAHLAHVSGSTYRTPAVAAGSGTNQAMTEDVTYYTGFFVPTKTTYDQMSIRTGSGHSGTSTVRLGIYEGRTGTPTTLILDAGTVSATGTSAVITLTINQTLDAGWYFFAANVQTPGDVPNFYSVPSTGSNQGALMGLPAALNASFPCGWSETGVTGAFADAGTVSRSLAFQGAMRVA